jgi:hypothetical protein
MRSDSEIARSGRRRRANCRGKLASGQFDFRRVYNSSCSTGGPVDADAIAAEGWCASRWEASSHLRPADLQKRAEQLQEMR